MIGTTVQHYRIGERLGAGGMGEVYRAEDVRLGRPVALKFLPHGLKSDPESRARLLNEARAASMLRSPNIAVTYDIGEHAGTDFIVMEYVDGELLSSLVAKGPLPVREAVEAGIQVADALDEAHSRGIVHRDIKSANLIRNARGLVKVLDFGLAKFLSAPHLRADAAADDGGRHGRRHRQLHGARTGARPQRRSPGGPVLARRRAVRARDGPDAVRGRHADRDHRSHPARGAAAGLAVHDRRAAVARRASCRARSRRTRCSGTRSARALQADLRQVADEIDGAPRAASSRAVAAAGSGQVANSVAVMTFANITPRAGRRLDRHRHCRDRQLRFEEHPRPDHHRTRARLRCAAQSVDGRAA